MSSEFALDIESRPGLGTGNSRRLRRQGKVPAIIYGGGRKPRAVMLDHARLIHEMEQEAFYTSILTLTLDDVSQPVVVKNVQRHPARSQVLHVDFQRILEDEKITLQVPLHFLGSDVVVGVREQGGEISVQLAEVEVSCLPKDLPEYIEVDISHLELNQRLHLAELELPDGVELPALAHGQDPSVITVIPRRQEEEDAVPELEDELGIVEPGIGEAPEAGEGDSSD